MGTLLLSIAMILCGCLLITVGTLSRPAANAPPAEAKRPYVALLVGTVLIIWGIFFPNSIKLEGASVMAKEAASSPPNKPIDAVFSKIKNGQRLNDTEIVQLERAVVPCLPTPDSPFATVLERFVYDDPTDALDKLGRDNPLNEQDKIRLLEWLVSQEAASIDPAYRQIVLKGVHGLKLTTEEKNLWQETQSALSHFTAPDISPGPAGVAPPAPKAAPAKKDAPAKEPPAPKTN